LGDRLNVAFVLSNLGHASLLCGKYEMALGLLQESLLALQDLGNRRSIAGALEVVAAALAGLGAWDQAARIWGASERLREEIGAPVQPSSRQNHQSRVSHARSMASDSAVFDQTWQVGRAMTMEQAISLALTAASTSDRPLEFPATS